MSDLLIFIASDETYNSYRWSFSASRASLNKRNILFSEFHSKLIKLQNTSKLFALLNASNTLAWYLWKIFCPSIWNTMKHLKAYWGSKAPPLTSMLLEECKKLNCMQCWIMRIFFSFAAVKIYSANHDQISLFLNGRECENGFRRFLTIVKRSLPKVDHKTGLKTRPLITSKFSHKLLTQH